MNIKDIISSISLELDDKKEVLYSNLSLQVPMTQMDLEIDSKKNYKGSGSSYDSKNMATEKTLFNSTMAEASQFLVFEEIDKFNNKITFNDLEKNVYNRYDMILNESNSKFIFSLKMPFYEWIKLQTELGNIIINIENGEPILSISTPIKELLKIKVDILYSITKEVKKAS